MSERRPLGDILQALGRVTQDDVERALEYQREHGGLFGEALVAMGLVKREEVEWTLASQFDVPYVFPQAGAVDPDAAALVTPDWAIRNNVLPITRAGDHVTVLVDSPLKDEVVQELERRTGLHVEMALASGDAIRAVAREVFSSLRRSREGLTTAEAISLDDLRRLARDSGAEHWGVSVREDRALGWYDHGTAIRRYRLGAGWTRELEGVLSPSPSERLPGLGEASWVARLEEGDEPALVEVRALSTPEGRELLFTRREALGSRDDPPPLPRGLLDEVRLVLEKGDVVMAVRCRPIAQGRELLPRLPGMLLPAGHRSLHLAAGGESMRLPGILVLPLDGQDRAVERRVKELREFRFDAVTAEVSPALVGVLPAVADLAPTTFFLLPESPDEAGLDDVQGPMGPPDDLPPGVAWLLELTWVEEEGGWNWRLRGVEA